MGITQDLRNSSDEQIPLTTSSLKIASPFRAGAERFALIAFWLFAPIWMGALIYAWTSHSGLNHGDSFSDANVLNAAKNFEKYGLGLNCGLSTHFGTWSPEFPIRPYTHYPPGPEWINMGLRKLGLHELWQFRAASIVFSSLALMLWWGIVRHFTRSNIVAFLACFFYSLSASFTEYSDSLHQHAVMQLTLMGCLASWLAFESASTPARRRLWLTIAAFLFFVDLWISFEHILLIPGVVAVRTFIVGFRRHWLAAFLVGSLPLLVIALRLSHNSFALGGMNAAIADLSGSAKYRSDGTGQAVTIGEVTYAWWQRLGAQQEGSGEYDPGYSFPVFKPRIAIALAALFLLFVAIWHRDELGSLRSAFGFGILLLVCGCLWFLAMRSHAMVHRHLVMLLAPGLSLLAAVLTANGFWQWSGVPKTAPVRFLGPALSIILIVWFAGDIRHSRAGSILFDADADFRKQLTDSQFAADMRSQAGKTSLANVERIHFVGEMYPELSYQVARPFISERALPEKLGQSEAIWIEYWTQQEQSAAQEALTRYGPPDVFSFPSTSLIFRKKNAAEAIPVDVSYELGIKLVQLRFAEALDQQAWVIQTVLEIPPSVKLDTLVGVVFLQDSAGAYKKTIDYSLSSAMPRGQRVVVSQIALKKLVEAHTRFRIVFWCSTEKRDLKPVDPANTQLPPQLSWDEMKTGILWRPLMGPSDK